jgi:glycosyltransferase involved in cell wall biosynthesis
MMTTPRPLLLTETHPPDRGGMAESCDRIVRGLQRAGLAVDVLHFDRRLAKPLLREGSGGTLLRWPLEESVPHAINCAWNRLRTALDLERTTHVMAFGGATPLAAAPAFAAWMARPLVTLLRGNELDFGLFDPRRRPLLEDSVRRAAAVCAVTTEQAGKVRALFPDANVQVVGNGIDFDLWQATAADHARAAAFRQAHAGGRRVLGFFGHLKAKKGVPFFLDVLRRSGVSDAFHLLLIGEAEELADDGLSVTRLPAVDRFDLLPYYLACDFVVLPSHYDGFPNVLIEAAALERPVLASHVGGMRDLVADGESALLFEPGDEAGARRALARAASMTSEEMVRLGRRAAELARLRCDARDEAGRYLHVLHETISAGRHSCVERFSSSPS